LSEQRVDHWEAEAVDRTPSPGIGGECRQGPHTDAAVATCLGEAVPSRAFLLGAP
jgi:hypothetical protein